MAPLHCLGRPKLEFPPVCGLGLTSSWANVERRHRNNGGAEGPSLWQSPGDLVGVHQLHQLHRLHQPQVQQDASHLRSLGRPRRGCPPVCVRHTDHPLQVLHPPMLYRALSSPPRTRCTRCARSGLQLLRPATRATWMAVRTQVSAAAVEIVMVGGQDKTARTKRGGYSTFLSRHRHRLRWLLRHRLH